VFGVTRATEVLASSALQAFANAGAAQPVALPSLGPTPTDPNAIFDQCSGVPAWAADLASTGKPAARGQSVAGYVGTAGTATVIAPAGDVPALLTQLRSELAPERPCSFDLAAAGVTAENLASLDENAELERDGTRIEHDEVDGWHLVDGTLQLEGASCSALRAAAEPALELRWACTP
jgi:hypothetical protein